MSEFSIGTSTTSTFNKWSVNSIEVYYSVEKTIDYATWAINNGLTGDHALPEADTSDFDGYSNLIEFAFGMNPNFFGHKSSRHSQDRHFRRFSLLRIDLPSASRFPRARVVLQNHGNSTTR